MKNIDYRDHAFRISLYASVVSVLVILSYRSYFLFTPFANGFDFLSAMGFISQLGWVALVVTPPLMLLDRSAKWTTGRRILMIAAVSLFTLATFIIKIYGLALTGKLWADYLIQYPILIFFEWVLPVYYVQLAFKLAKLSPARRAATEEASETKVTYPQA